VGPVWHGGKSNEDELLGNAYKNSLRLATEFEIKTVAFPNISTGVYGFPKQRAAEIAVHAVQDFLSLTSLIKEVFFVCFDEENYRIYASLLAV
jgi:O-acetyl-ADP-ribose deacetylase (regulator of RNase III)